MQSVCVYYVDLLNDMKTTVKTFLISMLLILTCSISGKAVDFAKVCVKSAETCKVSATLSSCSSTSSKKIKQESSKFADTRFSWTTDVELGTKPLTEIYSSNQQRIRRVIEDNIFLRNIFLILSNHENFLYMVGPNNTFQIKTRIMQLRAVIIISTRFGGFWFSHWLPFLISPFFFLFHLWREVRVGDLCAHMCWLRLQGWITPYWSVRGKLYPYALFSKSILIPTIKFFNHGNNSKKSSLF